MSENTPPNNPRILETSDTRRRVNKESQPLMSSASQSPPQRPMVPAIRAPVERVVSEGSLRQKSKHEAPVQHAHDTFGAFASSQAGYKLEGIRDMSVTANTSSIVQIIVNNGAEPRQFPISRELLIAKAVKFGLGGDPADHKVTTLTLTNVNTDAFNLFVNWLHGRDLPKVEMAEVFEAHDTTVPKPPIDLAKMPRRGPVFSPTVELEFAGEPYKNSYQHICFMNRYKSRSQEEIRLKLPFYCIIQSGSTLLARPAFAEKPRFMSDFIDRFDGTVIVPGCNVVRSGGNLQISTQPRMNEFRSTPLDNMHANNYRMDG
ncbi:hypothetical protein SCUP234_09628 [Seiridium cupressi]